VNTIAFSFYGQTYTWAEVLIGAALLTACGLFLYALRYILASNREAKALYGMPQCSNPYARFEPKNGGEQ
jgi:hypothetical protein